MANIKTNKNIARKLYNQGTTVFLIPHKESHPLFMKGFNNTEGKNFDDVVTNFTELFCDSASSGRYPHFYVDQEVLALFIKYNPPKRKARKV